MGEYSPETLTWEGTARTAHRVYIVYISAPVQSLAEELESYRTLGFWWVSRSVAIIDLQRETLIDGLRTYGGWRGCAWPRGFRG